jgi:branched-chain amino acid transport system permease protein
VRDNADRVGFLGFEPASIRFRVNLIAGALAGGAGALAAMLYEIVAVETVSLGTSANVLLMTVVGGATSAVGPLLGAVTMTAMQTVLARFTSAWAFYYGLLFVIVVLFAPRGLAGVFAVLRDDIRTNGIAAVVRRRAGAVLLVTVATAGAIVMIETLFRRTEADVGSATTSSLAAAVAGVVTAAALARLAGSRRRAP